MRDARSMNDQIRPKVFAAALSKIVVRFAVQQPDEAVRTLNFKIDVSFLEGRTVLRASICPAPRGKHGAPALLANI